MESVWRIWNSSVATKPILMRSARHGFLIQQRLETLPVGLKHPGRSMRCRMPLPKRGATCGLGNRMNSSIRRPSTWMVRLLRPPVNANTGWISRMTVAGAITRFSSHCGKPTRYCGSSIVLATGLLTKARRLNVMRSPSNFARPDFATSDSAVTRITVRPNISTGGTL